MTQWKYKDAAGVDRTGIFERSVGSQGSDVTYHFRRKDGTLDLVSGARLKAARLGGLDIEDARPERDTKMPLNPIYPGIDKRLGDDITLTVINSNSAGAGLYSERLAVAHGKSQFNRCDGWVTIARKAASTHFATFPDLNNPRAIITASTILYIAAELAAYYEVHITE